MPQGRIEDFDPQIFSQLIADAGMTRGYVAVMMGVTEAVVGRWVTGVGSPSAPRAKRLAELLGVDVLDLAGKTLETADITELSLIHISEPTRRHHVSRMPSSA